MEQNKTKDPASNERQRKTKYLMWASLVVGSLQNALQQFSSNIFLTSLLYTSDKK